MREYRRPPQVLSIEGPAQLVGEPLAITAKIRSESQLREAWLVIDGTNEVRQLPVKQSPDDSKLWQLDSGPIGIMEGAHVVRVHARNDEGWQLVPVEHRFVSKKPPSLPRRCRSWRSSTRSNGSTRPGSRFKYTVKSKVPAELRYELRANGNRGQFEEGILTADQLAIDGSVQTLPLELFEGSNEIVPTTRNSSGFGEKRRMVVSYTPPPVSFELASIGGVPLKEPRAVKGIRSPGPSWSARSAYGISTQPRSNCSHACGSTATCSRRCRSASMPQRGSPKRTKGTASSSGPASS